MMAARGQQKGKVEILIQTLLKDEIVRCVEFTHFRTWESI